MPFFESCDKVFKNLTPSRYDIQHERAQKTPNFSIGNTAFSTVTINYSWRTALHRDRGDLKEGFGNLVVIEDSENKNSYKGCYLGFPQYGVAVDTRTGDYLAMDVHEWHCNTEFIPVSKQVSGKHKDKDVINDWYFNRLSIVMYLREKMIKCKDDSLWINQLGGDYNELFYKDEFLLNNHDDSDDHSDYRNHNSDDDDKAKYQFEFEHPYFTNYKNVEQVSDDADSLNSGNFDLNINNLVPSLSSAFINYLPKEYISFINKRYEIFT